MNELSPRLLEQVKSGVRNELLGSLLTTGDVIKPPGDGLPRRPLSSREFATRDFTSEWFIESLLVKGQPGVIGGPKKSMKTSLSVDLVISLASGKPFLGRFPVLKPRRVCLYSGESGMDTLQETAERICKSKRVDLQAISAYWDPRLPPLNSEKECKELAKLIEGGKLELVIFDPLYLSLLAASSAKPVNPANLFEMGPLLQMISQTCLRAGATPIFVHHTVKMGGNKQPNFKSKYTPIELDDLSYSGIPEFARQWLLVNRREEYVPGTGDHDLWMSVGGSAGFSGCWAVDIDEGQIDRNFSGRGWKVTIRLPSEVHEEATVRKVLDKQKQDCTDRTKVLNHLKKRKTPQTQNDIQDATHIPKARVKAAVEYLIEQCQVEQASVIKPSGRGTRAYSGYTIPKPAKACG